MKKAGVATKKKNVRGGRGRSADIIFQAGDIRPRRRFTELQRRRLLRFYSLREKDNSLVFFFLFLSSSSVFFFFLLSPLSSFTIFQFFSSTLFFCFCYVLLTTRSSTSNTLSHHVSAPFSTNFIFAYASFSKRLFSFPLFFFALRTQKKKIWRG